MILKISNNKDNGDTIDDDNGDNNDNVNITTTTMCCSGPKWKLRAPFVGIERRTYFRYASQTNERVQIRALVSVVRERTKFDGAANFAAVSVQNECQANRSNWPLLLIALVCSTQNDRAAAAH